jgi:hypothetical protein
MALQYSSRFLQHFFVDLLECRLVYWHGELKGFPHTSPDCLRDRAFYFEAVFEGRCLFPLAQSFSIDLGSEGELRNKEEAPSVE